MQSESVELRILLSWSDELTIYTLLPLHRAFHVARAWPNSKYKDINEICIVKAHYEWVGHSNFWGAPATLHPPQPLCKTATAVF